MNELFRFGHYLLVTAPKQSEQFSATPLAVMAKCTVTSVSAIISPAAELIARAVNLNLNFEAQKLKTKTGTNPIS